VKKKSQNQLFTTIKYSSNGVLRNGNENSSSTSSVSTKKENNPIVASRPADEISSNSTLQDLSEGDVQDVNINEGLSIFCKMCFIASYTMLF